MNNRDDIINKLRSSGVTPTTQRVEIAQILFARPQHLSAEQILKMVNEESNSTASKATIYNTLGLFAKKGLVKEVIVDPSKVFYDSNVSKHFHFFNTDIGLLTDIPDDVIHIDELPELPQGTESSGIEVIVRIKNS
ncbi:MAG: Fur family transcriptional regulator [Gammaproteobacteria bacterium]|nr:MAG: Fur family transcriptional regulator [Gammaproteobacteria bacterium]